MPFSTYSPSQSCLLGLFITSKFDGCNCPSNKNILSLFEEKLKLFLY